MEYFRARRAAQGFEIEGALSCELGHRLPDGDGIFAAWSWDGERLTVTNDRYGFYPLFYCERDGEIAVSSSLAELVRRGAPTELDDVALAVFRSLYHSFFLAEDTPFLHIKAVPPVARFEWDGRLALEERPRPIGTRREIAREDALREYADLLREAVHRRVDGVDRFCTTLSGGHDSRQILLALCELGHPPAFCATLAYKFPPIENDDLEIARALAERLGIPHRVVPQLPRLEAELGKHEACHFLADDTAWYLAVGDYLRETGLSAFDGLGGDVFTAPWYQPKDRLDLYFAGRLDELAGRLLWRTPSAETRSDSPILRSEEVRALAHERIVRELARYVDAPNPLSAFAFWNKLRRENTLLPFGICSGVTCLCPYLDHRLFDFAASLPAELTLDGRFHTDVIAAAYPALAGFPYATVGKGRHLRASASLAARVGWYGVRTDPCRTASWAGAVTRMALDNLIPAYHARHEIGGPGWLLYEWQLEDLRRGRR